MNVAEIPVWGGYRALVDEVDYERLSAFKWHLARWRDKLYPVRTVGRDNAARARIMSHDVLKKTEPSLVVGYLDGNPMNNRRDNIICVARGIVSHRRSINFGTSGYKGVRRLRREDNPFQADIQKDHRRYRISGFPSAIAAARGYNSLAKALYGEEAYLNPIRSGDQFDDELVLRWLASRGRTV